MLDHRGDCRGAGRFTSGRPPMSATASHCLPGRRPACRPEWLRARKAAGGARRTNPAGLRRACQAVQAAPASRAPGRLRSTPRSTDDDDAMNPASDPAAFLRALFDAAVARAQPAQAIAPGCPRHRAGGTVVVGAGKAGAPWPRGRALWPPGAPAVGSRPGRHALRPCATHCRPRAPPHRGARSRPPGAPTPPVRRPPVASYKWCRALRPDLVLALHPAAARSLLAQPVPGSAWPTSRP